MCPASVFFATLLRFFCAFLSDRKASKCPSPAAYPPGLSMRRGLALDPWTAKPSGGVNRPWCGYPARPVRFHEPEEDHLSRSPGDFACVPPNHPGTDPTSPATQTGVSVMGRSEYDTGFQRGDLRGYIVDRSILMA